MGHETSALYNWLHASLDATFGEGFITDQAIMAWFIVAVSLIVFPLLSRRLSLYRPAAPQQMLEIGVASINTMCDAFMPPPWPRILPTVGRSCRYLVFDGSFVSIHLEDEVRADQQAGVATRAPRA